MALSHDINSFVEGAKAIAQPTEKNIIPITFRAERDLMGLIKKAMRAEGKMNRSEFIRSLIISGLTARGYSLGD